LSTQGVLYGLIDNHRDIPAFADLAVNGELMLDRLTTKKFKLEDINDVVEAMKNRQIQGRWTCEWD
jgi:Zn-dependent alcohol dehydrogenase